MAQSPRLSSPSLRNQDAAEGIYNERKSHIDRPQDRMHRFRLSYPVQLTLFDGWNTPTLPCIVFRRLTSGYYEVNTPADPRDFKCVLLVASGASKGERDEAENIELSHALPRQFFFHISFSEAEFIASGSSDSSRFPQVEASLTSSCSITNSSVRPRSSLPSSISF